MTPTLPLSPEHRILLSGGCSTNQITIVSTPRKVASFTWAVGSNPLEPTGAHDLRARWDNACVSDRAVTPASVRVLGAVCGVTPDGSIIDVPSPSQRRLLGLLAVHAPRQLRAEWSPTCLASRPERSGRQCRAFAQRLGQPRCAGRAPDTRWRARSMPCSSVQRWGMPTRKPTSWVHWNRRSRCGLDPFSRSSRLRSGRGLILEGRVGNGDCFRLDLPPGHDALLAGAGAAPPPGRPRRGGPVLALRVVRTLPRPGIPALGRPDRRLGHHPAAYHPASLNRPLSCAGDAQMTRAVPQDCLEAVREEVADGGREEGHDKPSHRPRG